MYYYLFVCDGESKLLDFFKHLSPGVVFLSVGKPDVSHILKIYTCNGQSHLQCIYNLFQCVIEVEINEFSF